MRSIRENPALLGLPDFRSPRNWLRIVVMTNLAGAVLALAANSEWRRLPFELLALASTLEPVLLLCLGLLSSSQEAIARLPHRIGILLVVLLTMLVTVAVQGLLTALATTLGLPQANYPLWHSSLWVVLTTLALLYWLHLIERAQTPALAEARLLALTARIRPHFLFNSLNAILGVIRSDPRRAESAIEELSDLFRVLMRDNTELVPLSEEIAVARQYINLEKLRLGERVNVRWDMTACPPDPLVPPLMLQPLLENAVYHGIEPATTPGEICITFERSGSRLRLELSNPASDRERQGHGNQMALNNIRERLMLFFSLDATLTTRIQDNRFVVSIELPYSPVSPA